MNAGVLGDGGSLADQALAAPEPSLNPEIVPSRPPRKAIAVDFLGVYDNAWLALHYMRLPAKAGPENASKSLIMTGSLASYTDDPSVTDYDAAKCELLLVAVFGGFELGN